MAEGGSDEIIEKVVCGLCSGEYKQPKLLPCFHSFCLECLEKYVETNVQGNAFDCPLCDATAEVPEGGVNEFEWNIYLDSKFKSETSESSDCDICGAEVKAVDHCTECEENYCERCAEIHLKLRATRTHTLIAISDHGARGTHTIKKKAFCTKHAKEEIKVVCKDCDKMLCVVCKLTDHEKHNSVDIEDEALHVGNNLKETIRRAENSLSKLDKILDYLNDAKDETSRNMYDVLEKLHEHGDKLKEQIDKKIKEIEAMVNDEFKDTSSNIVCVSTNTEKIRTSLTNLSMHATKIVSLSDITSLITKAGKLEKQMEQCISKAENHKVGKQYVGFNHWENHLVVVVKNLGLHLNNPPIKRVSNIGKCDYSSYFSSNRVCSISIGWDYCAMSSTDSSALSVVSSPGSNFEQPVYVKGTNGNLLSAVDNKVFISVTAKKEIIVWNKAAKTLSDVQKSSLFPHGIAHRFINGDEELVVCFLTDDVNLMSTKKSKGTVKVLPLDDKKCPYDFIAETFPAPTRVSVSKLEGLVCLSYPSVGSISVHTQDGFTIHCFDGYAFSSRQALFRPFGVCFDNENCLIIADRGGGQVLRLNLLGHVIQLLAKGNKPTAVGVGPDDKLWVGYEDKSVTVFQMTNQDWQAFKLSLK